MRRRNYRPLLLKWFHSPSIEKKEEAFKKLNLLPERDQIDVLFQLMEDPSWYLRENAAERVSRYGDEVVDRLVELLHSGVWYARAAAAIALGKIGKTKAIKPLTDILMQDRNKTVIKEVTRALTRIIIKNGLDVSYLDQFDVRITFLKWLNEYWPEYRAELGLR